MTPTLILASSSPRRRELLASLGVEFTIVKPDIDETQRPNEPPTDYVQRLSREKALAVTEQVAAPATILAADTVVILAADTIGIDEQGEILGKPADTDEARQMLQRLRGRGHTVATAVTLLIANGQNSRRQITEIARTAVHMRDYDDAEIDAYIATGDPFDKAGAYAIQHEGFHPVERIDGSYTNVVGLPVETVSAMLKQVGWPAG
jgi:MAF protein